MAVEVVFETHPTTDDNESGRATGWLPGRLSAAGEEQARRMGIRRRDDRLTAIFSSDLGRARQTVGIAFPDEEIPIFFDWRLRECDYGECNGGPVDDLDRQAHVDVAYPAGESWREAIERVGTALQDVCRRWDGSRVLLVGHTATRWALDHVVSGRSVEELVAAPFAWQEGWEYLVTTDGSGPRLSSAWSR